MMPITWRTVKSFPVATGGRPGRSGGYTLSLIDDDASRLGLVLQEAVKQGSQVRLRVERRKKGRRMETKLRLLSNMDKTALSEFIRLLLQSR